MIDAVLASVYCGDTLATLPAHVNGLKGKGVHAVTVNDYLAPRDTVGTIVHDLDDRQRQNCYTSDTTHGDNNELAGGALLRLMMGR